MFLVVLLNEWNELFGVNNIDVGIFLSCCKICNLFVLYYFYGILLEWNENVFYMIIIYFFLNIFRIKEEGEMIYRNICK